MTVLLTEDEVFLAYTSGSPSCEDLFGSPLQPEQLSVVTSALNGKHTLAVLPRRYGKTACYALLPLLGPKVCG